MARLFDTTMVVDPARETSHQKQSQLKRHAPSEEMRGQPHHTSERPHIQPPPEQGGHLRKPVFSGTRTKKGLPTVGDAVIVHPTPMMRAPRRDTKLPPPAAQLKPTKRGNGATLNELMVGNTPKGRVLLRPIQVATREGSNGQSRTGPLDMRAEINLTTRHHDIYARPNTYPSAETHTTQPSAPFRNPAYGPEAGRASAATSCANKPARCTDAEAHRKQRLRHARAPTLRERSSHA